MVVEAKKSLIELVKDTTTIGKNTDRLNEDLVVINDNFVAVIDGATAKSDHVFTWDGKPVTPGYLAAQVTGQTLNTLSPTASARDFFILVSETLNEIIEVQHPNIEPEARPDCSVVIYSSQNHEIWRVGDCSWRADDQEHVGFKEIDEITINRRVEVTLKAIEDGMSRLDIFEQDPGRQAILPMLEVQGKYANTLHELGFGVVNGLPIPDVYIEVTKLSPTVKEIVLASDGYPVISGTLAEAENALAELLVKDPLCYRELRGTKPVQPGAVSFDDRSWVALKFDS